MKKVPPFELENIIKKTSFVLNPLSTVAEKGVLDEIQSFFNSYSQFDIYEKNNDWIRKNDTPVAFESFDNDKWDHTKYKLKFSNVEYSIDKDSGHGYDTIPVDNAIYFRFGFNRKTAPAMLIVGK